MRSNGQWSKQDKHTADDAAKYDNFGLSVSVSGDTIVAGAPNDNAGADSFTSTLLNSLAICSRTASLQDDLQRVDVAARSASVGVLPTDVLHTNGATGFLMAAMAFPFPRPLVPHHTREKRFV